MLLPGPNQVTTGIAEVVFGSLPVRPRRAVRRRA